MMKYYHENCNRYRWTNTCGGCGCTSQCSLSNFSGCCVECGGLNIDSNTRKGQTRKYL